MRTGDDGMLKRGWSRCMVVCALVLTSGCGKGTDVASTPEFTREQAASFVIKVGEGWGPISFSTSRAEVEKALGPAERGLRKNALEYMSLGMAFTVNESDQVNQMLFGRVCASSHEDSLVQACRSKTSEGIGMLSSREKIIAAYGEPSSSRSESGVEEMQYRKLGTIFTLRDNRLVHIAVRGAQSN